MGDAELRKRAAEEAGRCEEVGRDHVPGDFRVRSIRGNARCTWCGEVVLDG
jgi:transposase